jgi:hypothetical protein
LNAGDAARELREEEEEVVEDINAGAELRREREEEELAELARCCFFAAADADADGADHSLSVAGEPGSSLALVDEPDTSEADEEAELVVSFWSFSSKSIKMRLRASL